MKMTHQGQQVEGNDARASELRDVTAASADVKNPPSGNGQNSARSLDSVPL